MKKLIVPVIIILIVIAGIFIYKYHYKKNSRLILIAIDSATWNIIMPMINKGELPAFKYFVDNGAFGSMAAEKTYLPSNPSYYNVFTPVSFATIATGKSPAEHNIHDFIAGYIKSNYRAIMNLSDVIKEPGTLYMYINPLGSIKNQVLTVNFNGKLIGKTYLINNWNIYSFKIDKERISNRNILTTFYTHREQPKNTADKNGKDLRELAFAIKWLKYIPDSNKKSQQTVDFSKKSNQIKYLKSGWYRELPGAKIVWCGKHIQEPITSDLLKARPFWDIFSEAGKSISIVGWWLTYPVVPVNGEMISLHLGHRSIYKNMRNNPVVKELVYPENLFKRIQPLMTDPDSILSEFNKNIFHYDDLIKARGLKYAQTIKEIYWQDNMFHKMGLNLLKNKKRDVFTIYYEGVDTISHLTWQYRINDKYKNSSLHDAVKRYYIFQDKLIQDYLNLCRPNDYIMLISDHGFGDVPVSENLGDHWVSGIFALIGPYVNKKRIKNITTYDIMPTLLYMENLSLAKDMRGRVIKEAFTEKYNSSKKIKFINSYESRRSKDKSKKIINQRDKSMDNKYYQRLKTIGYF